MRWYILAHALHDKYTNIERGVLERIQHKIHMTMRCLAGLSPPLNL